MPTQWRCVRYVKQWNFQWNTHYKNVECSVLCKSSGFFLAKMLVKILMTLAVKKTIKKHTFATLFVLIFENLKFGTNFCAISRKSRFCAKMRENLSARILVRIWYCKVWQLKEWPFHYKTWKGLWLDAQRSHYLFHDLSAMGNCWKSHIRIDHQLKQFFWKVVKL